jgi:glycosyltransferase involved in cell wall biosynthesis
MPDPIRILELRSVRGTGGGPDKTIVLGAARADRARFHVTVTYIRDVRDSVFSLDTAARRAGVDYLEVTERHSLDWTVLPALRAIVRARAIDIVHAHDYKTDLLTLALARTEGVIPLATAHGWSGHGWRERFVYYPLDRRLLRRFPRVVVVSRDMAARLEDAGVQPDRLIVLRNGIEHHVYRRSASRRTDARAALGLDSTAVVVGAVGRLEQEKRYDLLIDAVARVAERWPAVQLLIAGEGSLRASLETRARERLGSRCRLLGHCSDVIAFHHAIDLFVQTSNNEGSPNAVLEAMAIETPVVATDVGGTSDLITDQVHGLLVERGDVAGIAAAIERTIADSEETGRRVVCARGRVERELSFAARQRALEALYDALILERHGAGGPRVAMGWA